MGHIIDLPKSRLAIDIENNFNPEYITIRGKAKILNDLKKKAKTAKMVLLATDPDREGEAISWHLHNSLSKNCPNIKRIEFNEITESAIKEAVKHPRDINIELVNAQQARRVLDRIVGYFISPILWRKVKKGLSAGRVQSVALKVICEREKEIDAFVPEEYWDISADLKAGNAAMNAALYAKNGEKFKITGKEAADKTKADLEKAKYIVESVNTKDRKRNPLPPYITSKLQQDAANRLGFTSSKTMMVAQQLYEGIPLGTEGPVGLITYMRTDSLRISETAINAVRQFISDKYSPEYLPASPNQYQNKKGAQDAHEAIRPSDILRDPEKIKEYLTKDQYKLYSLIWKRFVSSQMTPEKSELISAVIKADEYELRASASKTIFDGFTVLEKEEKSKKNTLPKISEGDILALEKINSEQHFTSPPPRFNDASLVKFLEESGIGRPSTYAPTINTLIKRYYIVRSGRQLVPTVLGKLVNGLIIENFKDLVSVDFTAEMEAKLDGVEEKKYEWHNMIADFFTPFSKTVEEAEKQIADHKGSLDEKTDEVCEKCGKPMLKKLGKFGYFLACSGFPECRNSKSLPLGKCPKDNCDGSVVKRSSKKGRPFYSCSNYPDCDFITREIPSDKPCPKCGKLLFSKRIKNKGVKLSCLNEKCGYTLEISDGD
jgi:DNA topoisomerase-1